MKQIQMPNSSAQGSQVTTTNGLRCSDFNYSNLHKSYYNNEQDKLGSASSSFRRQIVSMQDRKHSNIYGRYKEYQYVDSKSKKDEMNNKSVSKDMLNIEEHDNISQHKEPIQSPLIQSLHQSKYQTPQKGSQSYHSRSYTVQLSDQFIQQSDKKLESESPLGDSKQQINQKYLRYTTDHVRYSTPFKGEITNKSDKQEENLYLSQKISKQELKKLQDSPTKENEQYNIEEKQQTNPALQSYSGFISRTQNNYYKRQTAFESPVSDEKNLLKESYSKVLNYQTSSAYSKDSHLNSSIKSYRATQSEKKSFQEEIEQYKKELKEYQSQLSSYQEQLKNSLNKNKIELFDGLTSIRDSNITSSISQYSKASFLDLKYSTQNSKYQVDSETPKTLQKLESDQNSTISSRLGQSATFSKVNSKIQKPHMGIFDSIYIDAENLEEKPEKMLQVVNIENSAVLPNDKKEIMEGFSEKKIIKIQKVESFYEEREPESKNYDKEESQNFIQQNSFQLSSLNGETNNKRCFRSQSVTYKEVPDKESQLHNYKNEKTIDYQTRSKASYSIDQNTPLLSSAVFSNHRSNLVNTLKDDYPIMLNSKDCNQQLPNFQKIDSVISDSLACPSQHQQSIIQNSNQLISEESSTKQNIMQRSNLQATKQDSSENIIKTQYDKLKEIENRYKRVEEISKKYSHLYKSKLLQPTQTSITTEQKTSLDLSASVPANSTDYKNEQNINSTYNNLIEKRENNNQYSFAQQNKDIEMTSVCLFPNVRDSGVMPNKDQNSLGVPLPISNRIQGGESDINFFMQKTPRFQTMDGEEYFKTAEQILQLSRQSANKLDQSLCLTDRETLQNLSQVDMDCELKHQMQQSPSVTAL
ncbi:hypothetical protein TTHERM_00463630 (macronuclear) [Tetrahymena thermophila SB210]|uniref:Uncharacterized protein n=1 Tax=Tetrahymena thermophila (strain SB210) TaxID=312017 RepID=Q23PS0_TETTS|nr:hypothetical protein TTHERM_00463630 [Tetrahymena thermophila SB210]EAR98615.2 hypothetical protein TTHERM_00463630 [Tetrahymena thermophila SB210]|eukprot:XP_001018860.2 hypothetical protein TTHERM_00463630 [Tetrahymena thermophila SB210]